MIAVFRSFVQFSGLDLSAPSVCGGFLGVSSEQSDLHDEDRCLPTVRAVATLMISVSHPLVALRQGQAMAAILPSSK
jgi:hypothetical protein